MSTSMTENPKIVSRDEWLAARTKLLAKEKQHTCERDALAAERRQLPWVKVEKNYVFDSPGGKKTLADLFDLSLIHIFGRVLSRVFAAIAAGVEWQDSSRKLNLSASFHTETRDKRQLGLLRSWSHEEGARVRRMRRFEHKVRYVGERCV